MVSLPARLALFLSSYAPLWFIFAVLYLNRDNVIAGTAALACLGGLLGLYWICLSTSRNAEPISATVAKHRERGDETLAYVVTYLIPFVGFSLTDPRQLIALLTFLVLVGYLYVTSDMLHINPMLRMLGFHMYEVTFEPDHANRLITRRQELHNGTMLHIVRLDQHLWIERNA